MCNTAASGVNSFAMLPRLLVPLVVLGLGGVLARPSGHQQPQPLGPQLSQSVNQFLGRLGRRQPRSAGPRGQRYTCSENDDVLVDEEACGAKVTCDWFKVPAHYLAPAEYLEPDGKQPSHIRSYYCETPNRRPLVCESTHLNYELVCQQRHRLVEFTVPGPEGRPSQVDRLTVPDGCGCTLRHK